MVTRVDGLEAFPIEHANARHEAIDGLSLPLLPLERILASKRAAGRPKDLLAAHLIEDAIVARDHESRDEE